MLVVPDWSVAAPVMGRLARSRSTGSNQNRAGRVVADGLASGRRNPLCIELMFV